MDLLLSCVLLVLFVAVVEYTAVGSVGDGIVGLFGGLFSHPDSHSWPQGVQEDDDRRLVSLAALGRLGRGSDAAPLSGRPGQPAPGDPFDDSDGWLRAEIVDDVPPVPVAPVRRLT
jgi:hypothetical protein